MIKGVKYNIKRSYKDLICRFCQSGEEETQEHLEVCGLCRVWFWKKRVEDVCEKWYSEVLAQNGEDDDGEETSREERGGEE